MNHEGVVNHCDALMQNLRAAAQESEALAAEYRKEAGKYCTTGSARALPALWQTPNSCRGPSIHNIAQGCCARAIRTRASPSSSCSSTWCSCSR